MGALLPYLLIAMVSLWAVVATALAVGRGRGLEQERQDLAAAEETIERYRAALLQLKARMETTAREFDLLQQAHVRLQATLEAEHQAVDLEERPIPMIMIDSLDISPEVGTLFEHVARVAVAVRNYSAYTRGHQGSEPAKARYDLLWLADSLHTLDQVGRALAGGSQRALARACEELASMYERYLKDNGGYNSRDTFQRLAGEVPLGEVTEAVRSILAKISQGHADLPTSAQREREVDQIVAGALH